MKNTPPRRGAISMMFYWLKTLILGFFCRCPKCSRGSVFQSFFVAHKECPSCGVTLQPYFGDSAGVMGLGYLMFLPPSVILAIMAGYYLKWGPVAVFFTFAFSSTGLLLAFYRNMKSMWIAIVYLMTGLRKNL